jgi:hypothetical protein
VATGIRDRYSGRSRAKPMSDQDLGGDCVKVVRCQIVFTMRGLEAILHDAVATVDYPTDATSYGGALLAQFMEQVTNGQMLDRDHGWRRITRPDLIRARGALGGQFPNKIDAPRDFSAIAGRVSRQSQGHDAVACGSSLSRRWQARQASPQGPGRSCREPTVETFCSKSLASAVW